MKEDQSTNVLKLMPLPGYALVQLKEKYESGLSTDKEKYAQRSEGILVEMSFVIGGDTPDAFGEEEFDNTYNMAQGCEVYFAPFTDGEPIKHDGHEYVFIPIKELRGFKNA